MSRAKLNNDDFVIASDNFKKYFLEETKTDIIFVLLAYASVVYQH